MDAAIKEKWLADLRSGKYAQTDGALYNKKVDGYCCIGVLCLSAGAVFDDFEEDHPDGWGSRSFADVPVLDGRNIGAGDEGELSREYMAEIGLTAEQQKILIKMNDSGTPFYAIADYIERNL